MTEKRYSYFKSPITGLYVISDEKLRETFSGIDDEYNCNRIVRILNTKEKVIEQLIKDLKKKFVPFAKADGNYTTVNTEEFIKILNENEQLEQKIKYLEAQLYCENEDGICLICSNHYLVKEKTHDKYYISKCKKEHDECSKEILRHCKDFELKSDVK